MLAAGGQVYRRLKGCCRVHCHGFDHMFMILLHARMLMVLESRQQRGLQEGGSAQTIGKRETSRCKSRGGTHTIRISDWMGLSVFCDSGWRFDGLLHELHEQADVLHSLIETGSRQEVRGVRCVTHEVHVQGCTSHVLQNRVVLCVCEIDVHHTRVESQRRIHHVRLHVLQFHLMRLLRQLPNWFESFHSRLLVHRVGSQTPLLQSCTSALNAPVLLSLNAASRVTAALRQILVKLKGSELLRKIKACKQIKSEQRSQAKQQSEKNKFNHDQLEHQDLSIFGISLVLLSSSLSPPDLYQSPAAAGRSAAGLHRHPTLDASYKRTPLRPAPMLERTSVRRSNVWEMSERLVSSYALAPMEARY
jgi:hypothetical protein